MLVLVTVVATVAALVGLGAPVATAASGAAPHSSSASSRSAAAVSAVTGAGFVPVTPSRVLDTRSGVEPGAGSTTTVTMTGHGGVPASGVAAVVVNVTAVSAAAPGFVTAWPAGAARPTASSLNYVRGQIVANQAVVKLGTSGRISLYTLAKANLLVDVTGYYPTGAAYDPLVPARILDTRKGTEPAAGSTTRLVVTGKGGVPATGAAAVVLNVTAVNPSGPGYVTAYPAGVPRPTASTLNYTTGSVVAGMTVAKVGAGGTVDLYTLAKANLVVDVAGWIPAGSDYTPITPTRILDTRTGLGGPKRPVPAKGTVAVQVTGKAGVPANATAVEVTVTAVTPAEPGFVTAYPTGVSIPTASTLNYVKGAIVANSATLKLGTSGKVSLYTLAASNLLVDVTGYYTPPAPPGGMTWGAPTSADPPRGYPTSVSCPTASFCVAVDQAGDALTWSGSGWSKPAAIDPETYANFDGITSVSCPTSSFCAAVDGLGHALTFNGTRWSNVVTIDTNPDPDLILLESVSCSSSNSCVAVDGQGNAFSFNGSSWSAAKSIDSSGGLSSVSCPSNSFCAAVDSYGNVLTFNVATWSAAKSIDPGNLTSVSCPTASFCAAVDGDGNVVTFNGATWSAPKSIDPAGGSLASVSCPTATFCAAVDYAGKAVTFNGATWSAPTSVDPAGGGLVSVSCPSSRFCAAVDYAGNAIVGRA